MTKEILTLEFRYYDKPIPNLFNGSKEKIITIGIFDTLEDAITEGNKTLDILSKKFEVRSNDIFKYRGLFGTPNRLVSNTCYPTNGIEYFAKITQMKFDDLSDTIDEIFKAFDRYKEFKKAEQK